jgi:hypothetical protein
MTIDKNEDIQKYRMMATQYYRIIQDSAKVINNTKKLDTAMEHYDTLKENMKRLIEIAPLAHSAPINLEFRGYPVKELSDLALVDKAKEMHKKFFLEKKARIDAVKRIKKEKEDELFKGVPQRIKKQMKSLIKIRPLMGRFWSPLKGDTLPCLLRGQG